MAITEALEDVLVHPEQHSEPERALTLEVALYQLRRPISAEEAAGILGVTKPTVHSWARAGLLPVTDGSGPRRVLLDPASVFAAKKVLQGARLSGAPAQRVLRLRALTEAIYWATHPDELSALEESLRNEDEGRFVDVDDDLIDEARQRLAVATRKKP